MVQKRSGEQVNEKAGIYSAIFQVREKPSTETLMQGVSALFSPLQAPKAYHDGILSIRIIIFIGIWCKMLSIENYLTDEQIVSPSEQ